MTFVWEMHPWGKTLRQMHDATTGTASASVSGIVDPRSRTAVISRKAESVGGPWTLAARITVHWE